MQAVALTERVSCFGLVTKFCRKLALRELYIALLFLRPLIDGWVWEPDGVEEFANGPRYCSANGKVVCWQRPVLL